MLGHVDPFLILCRFPQAQKILCNWNWDQWASFSLSGIALPTWHDIYLSMASFDLSLRHVFLGSWPSHRLLGFVCIWLRQTAGVQNNDIGSCISSAVSCSNLLADLAHRSCISSVVIRVNQLVFLRPNNVIFSCFFSMIRCLWFAETNTHCLLAHLWWKNLLPCQMLGCFSLQNSSKARVVHCAHLWLLLAWL